MDRCWCTGVGTRAVCSRVQQRASWVCYLLLVCQQPVGIAGFCCLGAWRPTLPWAVGCGLWLQVVLGGSAGYNGTAADAVVPDAEEEEVEPQGKRQGREPLGKRLGGKADVAAPGAGAAGGKRRRTRQQQQQQEGGSEVVEAEDGSRALALLLEAGAPQMALATQVA